MTKRYYKYAETHRTIKGRKQKYCTTCKRWKVESDFRKDRAKRDGLRIRCRDCDDAYEQEYRRQHRGDVREYLTFEQRHRIVNGVKQKLCGKCNQWKDENRFSRNRSSRDGLGFRCKECDNTQKSHERQRKGARRNLRYQDRHRVTNGVNEKLCTMCARWKKESEYYKNRSIRDGLSTRCKKCSYTATIKSGK